MLDVLVAFMAYSTHISLEILQVRWHHRITVDFPKVSVEANLPEVNLLVLIDCVERLIEYGSCALIPALPRRFITASPYPDLVCAIPFKMAQILPAFVFYLKVLGVFHIPHIFTKTNSSKRVLVERWDIFPLLTYSDTECLLVILLALNDSLVPLL